MTTEHTSNVSKVSNIKMSAVQTGIDMADMFLSEKMRFVPMCESKRPKFPLKDATDADYDAWFADSYLNPKNATPKHTRMALKFDRNEDIIILDLDIATASGELPGSSLMVAYIKALDPTRETKYIEEMFQNVFIVKTPSGGYHMYFSKDETKKEFNKKGHKYDLSKIKNSSSVQIGKNRIKLDLKVANTLCNYIGSESCISAKPEVISHYMPMQTNNFVGPLSFGLYTLLLILCNSKQHISKLDYREFQEYLVKVFKDQSALIVDTQRIQPDVKKDPYLGTDEQLTRLVNLIDIGRFDDYDNWVKIMAAFKDIDKKEHARVHSMRSAKYNKVEFELKWAEVETMTDIHFGTLAQYVKWSCADLTEYNTIMREIGNTSRSLLAKYGTEIAKLDAEFLLEAANEYVAKRAASVEKAAATRNATAIAKYRMETEQFTPDDGHIIVYQSQLVSLNCKKLTADYINACVSNTMVFINNLVYAQSADGMIIQSSVMFNDTLKGIRITIGDIRYNLTDYIISNRQLWTVDKIVYDMSAPVGIFSVAPERNTKIMTRVWNTFSGFAVKPIVDDGSKYQQIIDHIRDVWCGNEPNAAELVDYILDWFAYAIQTGRKCGTAIVLYGQQGVGKNVILTWLAEKVIGKAWFLLGRSLSDLTGRFTTDLENKSFIVIDEASDATNSYHATFDQLKKLITEDNVKIEAKGSNSRSGRCVANVIITSNNSIPIKLDDSDRRYLVLDCTNKYKGDLDYFSILSAIMDNEMIAASFLNMLLTRKWADIRKVPQTAAKEDLRARSNAWSTITRFAKSKPFIDPVYSATDIKKLYVQFCADNSCELEKVDLIAKLMCDRVIDKYTDNVGRTLIGQKRRGHKINPDYIHNESE